MAKVARSQERTGSRMFLTCIDAVTDFCPRHASDARGIARQQRLANRRIGTPAIWYPVAGVCTSYAVDVYVRTAGKPGVRHVHIWEISSQRCGHCNK
jgi:hypothetical protein